MKRIFAVILLLLLTLLLEGCVSTLPVVQQKQPTNNLIDSSDKKQTKKLIFSLDLPPSHNWCKATRRFGELVKEKTNSSIEIEVFDSAALGTQRDALEGMLVGTINGTVSLEPLSYWVKDIGMFGIPYLFRDEQHLRKFFEGDLGQELHQKLVDAGFRPITYFVRAPRQITSNVPIHSVKDLKGIKIRVPETPTGPAAFEVMGATAVTMPFSEVYSALQQNIVDAQENPLNLIVANKFYEVQNYVTITNHQYQAAYLLLDEKTYQNLTDIEKAAINEAAKETQVYESELLKADLEKSIKTLEENGVVIISPDIKEFAKTVEKAYQEYDMLMQAWIIKIKSLK